MYVDTTLFRATVVDSADGLRRGGTFVVADSKPRVIHACIVNPCIVLSLFLLLAFTVALALALHHIQYLPTQCLARQDLLLQQLPPPPPQPVYRQHKYTHTHSHTHTHAHARTSLAWPGSALSKGKGIIRLRAVGTAKHPVH